MNQKKRELEQNELASVLEEKLEALRPHAFLIGAIIVAVLGIIVLSVYLIASRRAIEGSRWQEFFLASSAQPQTLPDARLLENMANDNQGTVVAAIALIKAADVDMLNSLGRSTDNEDELLALLRRAKKNYGSVVDSDTQLHPFWKRRALHGLAYACETLGELDEAKQHYQRLVDEAKDTPIFSLAKSGLKRVSNPSAIAVVAAFEHWKPASEAPGPTGLPERPRIDFSIDSQPFGFDFSTEGTLNSPEKSETSIDDAPPPPKQDDDEGTGGGDDENKQSDNDDNVVEDGNN